MVKTNAMMETVIPPATWREEAPETGIRTYVCNKHKVFIWLGAKFHTKIPCYQNFMFDKDLWHQTFTTDPLGNTNSWKQLVKLVLSHLGKVHALRTRKNQALWVSIIFRTSHINPNSNIKQLHRGLTNHVKHEVPYQEAQCHSTAKYKSSRWKDKWTVCQWIIISIMTVHTSCSEPAR